MNDANHALLEIYEEIKRTLGRELHRETGSFFQLVEEASLHMRFIEGNRDFLRKLRDIRDLLAHPAKQGIGEPVVVTDAFLRHAQKILDKVRHIPRARDLGVPLNALFTAQRTDNVGDVARRMREKRYSH